MDLRTYFSFDDLANEAERLVIDELGRRLEEAGMVEQVGEETVLDLAAYALNKVPPMYRANLLGRLYATSLEEEHARAIREAVDEALERILG